MEPYGPDVVNLRSQVDGYRSALERFAQAAGQKDPGVAFQPLFEALSWVHSIDDRLRQLWAPEGRALGEAWIDRAGGGAKAVLGLRWVRNIVHHQWADALVVDPGGRRYPKRYPVRYFEWVWRETDDLPKTNKTNGKDEYERYLAGLPADVSLNVLAETFADVADLIAPPLRRNRGVHTEGPSTRTEEHRP